MLKASYLLILNGSPLGKKGNSAAILKLIKNQSAFEKVKVVHLKDSQLSAQDHFRLLAEAQAVLFITGTYWDSWGSPLQKFLEDFTPFEGHKKLLGKPAGVVTLMHSVGGKEVLSRLQGVLNTFGFQIPPMSGMAYSLVSEIALKTKSTHAEDFWSLEDLQIILQNLMIASQSQANWQSWPVDRKNPKRLWLGKSRA